MFDWQVSEQGICQLDSLGGGRTGGGPAMTIHSDCGGRYRWPEWIAICDENSLVRSVSVKGGSHDGGEREGFFGGPKNEFFHHRDWSGAMDVEVFMAEFDACLRNYCEGRIKESLCWTSPNEHRGGLGYAVWAGSRSRPHLLPGCAASAFCIIENYVLLLYVLVPCNHECHLLQPFGCRE